MSVIIIFIAIIMCSNINSVIYRSQRSIIVIQYSFLLSWYKYINQTFKPLNNHKIKVVCVDHIIALLVCIIHWAIINFVFWFILVWQHMKQTMYKMIHVEFLHFIIWCTIVINYSIMIKSIMIIDIIVKSLLHTTNQHNELWHLTK